MSKIPKIAGINLEDNKVKSLTEQDIEHNTPLPLSVNINSKEQENKEREGTTHLNTELLHRMWSQQSTYGCHNRTLNPDTYPKHSQNTMRKGRFLFPYVCNNTRVRCACARYVDKAGSFHIELHNVYPVAKNNEGQKMRHARDCS